MGGLSKVGTQMSRMSGLRSLMEDVASAMASTSDTKWLNLSIGNPAAIPEVTAMWREAAGWAVAESFSDAVAYGPSRGSPALVKAIADHFRRHLGWTIGPENIVVGPGSQMLCFAAAALYAGEDGSGARRVGLPAIPDYTGYQGICMAPGGIAGVESGWRAGQDRSFHYELDLDATARRTDLGMLLLSSPCNPTGRSLRADEQDALIAIAQRMDVPLFLDHAYGRPFPQIGPTFSPPVLNPHVVNCFSLSKAGMPGERVGFAVGPERYITPLVSFLSNSVLHASGLAQAMAAWALSSGALDEVVASAIKPFYAERRTLTEQLLLDAMPADVNWRLHANEGGMFGWLWIDEDWFSDVDLYADLRKHNVFIAPGRSFFSGPPEAGRHSTQCFRITLTVDEKDLREGISRIGGAVGEASPHRVVSRPPLSR
ncbi:aminotransferase class I/II-fold pyridoxal phosphate-dependent enzyme [Streptomyces sp. NPDC048279]|uniref:aminotransferase class I/II-fold pyridoxal phosphate-dependent enzyme n=1 Tax=Streptomyces sp. NPDC048279 TaxID=3154714 RepID=UPI003417FCE0